MIRKTREKIRSCNIYGCDSETSRETLGVFFYYCSDASCLTPYFHSLLFLFYVDTLKIGFRIRNKAVRLGKMSKKRQRKKKEKKSFQILLHTNFKNESKFGFIERCPYQ